MPGSRRRRAERTVELTLSFDDAMELVLALSALSPDELGGLGSRPADCRKLIDRLLRSIKSAARDEPLTIALPISDVGFLQRFAVRALPFRASNAAMLDRVARTLSGAPLAPSRLGNSVAIFGKGRRDVEIPVLSGT